MRRRRGLLLGLGAVAAVLVAGRLVAGAWADWRWFEALGAGAAWRAAARDALAMRGLACLVAGAFAAVNLAAVRQSVLQLVLPRQLGDLEIGEEVPPRVLHLAVAALAVVVGLAAAAFAPDGPGVGAALDGARFGETDPYWQRDLATFVTDLPFEAAWYEWSVVTAGAVALLVMVCYALTPALRWRDGRLHLSGWVRRHVTVLGAAALLLLAWGLRLDAYTRAIEGSGPEGLVTALDHRVLVPAGLLLALAALVAGLLVLRAGWTGQLRVAFGAVSVVLLGMLGVRGVLPLVGDALVAGDGDSAAYDETRRAFTRRAYAVEAMRVTAPGATEGLPGRAPEALDGVPAWDAAALARVVERSRPGVRVVGDAGWWVDGAYGVVLAVAPASPDAGPWTIVTTDPRRDADDGGLPTLTERPVAPVRVYDGAVGPLVVTDPARRLPAPRIGGWAPRLGHAWALQQPGLLSSPPPDAVLLETRDVRGRVARLVPAFAQGSAVVPIVAADTLWWGLDLYAASAWFPVSRRFATRDGDVRYLRHAATALVNATTGEVRLAAREDVDAPARAALARVAGLTMPRDRLDAALGEALPPPVDQARAQASAFAQVGARELPPASGRRLPAADGGDTLVARYGPSLWRATSGRAAWSVPLVSPGDTVTGVVVATGGPTPVTRWAPSATRPLWGESHERLATAAGPAPTEPRRALGQVRVVPRADGAVVLVQPRFAWPVAGPPALDGIAALVDGEARQGRTMAAVGAPLAAGREPPVDDATRARLGPLYDRLRAALQRGDFPEFGRLLDAIGRLLGRVPEARRDR